MASRGVNKAVILGNVGEDPSIRYMPNGKAVANFTVATSESWKDQQGQKQEKTEWHRIVAYDKLAEIIGEYVKKGSKLYLEGKLQTRKWQDQQGQDRYTTEIIVSEMQMLDGKPQQGGQQSQGQQQQQPQRQQLTAAARIDLKLQRASISSHPQRQQRRLGAGIEAHGPKLVAGG